MLGSSSLGFDVALGADDRSGFRRCCFVCSLFLTHAISLDFDASSWFDDRGIGCIWLVAALILTFSQREKGQEPVLIQTFSLSTGARGHEKTLTSRNSSSFMSSPVGKWKGRIKLIERRCVEEDGLRWVTHRVDGDLRVEE